MAAVTIRNLSEEAHRALKIRAAQNARGTEADQRIRGCRPQGD
jgi:antitoxin FitA